MQATAALTTDQKGAIAETAIIHAAVKLGIGVFKPITDGERYDLIFDLRPRLVRVQCKWAPLQGNVVVVRSYSNRRTANGLVRRCYATGEIDAIAAYCSDLDCCYYLPEERVVGHQQLGLRVAPSLNNQISGINWAGDYEFAATLRRLVGP